MVYIITSALLMIQMHASPYSTNTVCMGILMMLVVGMRVRMMLLMVSNRWGVVLKFFLGSNSSHSSSAS